VCSKEADSSQPPPVLLHGYRLKAYCIQALIKRLDCSRVLTFTAVDHVCDSTDIVHPQIPELPVNLKPAPGAEAAVVPKRRFQPPRPEEHFYAAMRAACASMELLVKDGRWALAPHLQALRRNVTLASYNVRQVIGPKHLTGRGHMLLVGCPMS
jgi:hypothetical protein